MAESNNLVLKKISDIAGVNFFIPSFQRGYRWDIMQVEDLLNDIKEYIDIENKESFLCLQPVVVYEKERKYVVIDGQQRLTATAIIKYYLNMNNIYSIEYEKYINNNSYKNLDTILSNAVEKITKEKITTFIATYKLRDDLEQNDINTIDELFTNLDSNKANHKLLISLTNELLSEKCSLDEYHIILSYLVIAYYFHKNSSYKDKFIKLFSSTIDNNSIQFIWYNVTDEIQDDEKKAIEIFTRLNIGKIQLTDAELIKALFLKKDNFKESEIDKKLHIAYKWDEIEKTLNNDTFWYFISNKNEDEMEKRNRIELILELAIDTQNGKNHELFKEYENKFRQINNENKDNKNNLHNIDNLWQKIEECFMTLKEWYNDNELYHYVGFLLNNKLESIENIYKCDNIKNKAIEKIKTKISNDINEINNYTFYDNKKQIELILFFSNIYETICSNQAHNSNGSITTTIINRFPFNLYVQEKFDVEHISPQTENPLNHKEERILWFKESYAYLNNINFSDINDKEIKDNLTEEHIKNIYENEDKNNIIFSNDKWSIVYDYIIKVDQQNELQCKNEEQYIGNLVLLPSDINRSYKNALFGVKRKHIIKDEAEYNRFIPIVTKHAFLKYYSDNTINFWTYKDAQLLREKTINNLASFLGINKGV